MSIFRAFLAVVIIWGEAASLIAQELSTTVYPSEDELLEALQQGEIEVEQYLNLLEIALDGIDRSTAHHTREIPNLSLSSTTRAGLTSLESRQLSPFVRPAIDLRQFHGSFRHKFYQEMDDPARSKYRLQGDLYSGSRWRLSVRFQREFSGRERIVNRYLKYQPDGGFLKELIVGNFSRRLGLGTVVGYRGKLLALSDRIDNESLLIPDYGGQNGLFASAGWNGLSSQVLFSATRDSLHSLTTTAGMISMVYDDVSAGLVVGINRLEKREDKTDHSVYSMAAHVDRRHGSGREQLEATIQSSDAASGAIVGEGTLSLPKGTVRYAAWWYGNNFDDISSGSRAANLRRHIDIEDVSFSYSSKRAGQAGGMIKSRLTLANGLEQESSILMGRINDDSLNLEFLTGFVQSVGDHIELRLDYLSRQLRRNLLDQPDQVIRRRTRFVAIYKADRFYFRGYGGYGSRSGEPDHLIIFMTLRHELRAGQQFELWSNLNRINLASGQVDYWYGYLKSEIDLPNGMRLASKISHSFRRTATVRHQTTISLESVWRI